MSQRTIEVLQAEGTVAPDGLRSYGPVRVIVTADSRRTATWIRYWSRRLPRPLSRIDARDPAGKAVLEGEACKAFVPSITTVGRPSRKRPNKPAFCS